MLTGYLLALSLISGDAPANLTADQGSNARLMQAGIARQTFEMLRESDRARVMARLEMRPMLASTCGAQGGAAGGWVGRSVVEGLSPLHRRMVDRFAEQAAEGRAIPAMCYAPDTSPAVIAAFEQFRRARLGDRQDRFWQVQRWVSTASSPGPFNQGDPTVLTYSFVPDGTIVPNRDTAAPSNLFAFLNGIYGSPEVWQALYGQMFARWAELCGTSYVFEPNDDGVQIDGSVPASGVLGVRGDCRMAGTFIDGPSNVLAFNFFPADDAGGDMVIDTGDTFYNDTTNNSLRLLNVLWHEHGHGLGMAHVCPRTNSKLMEPSISLAFSGPQIDDILNAQRHYGDNNEPNDTPGTATPVPALTTAQTFSPVSIDNGTDEDLYLVTAPSFGVTSVTVTPLGGVYADNPQDAECTAQGFSEPGTYRQLTVDARDAATGSLLASWTDAQRGPISRRLPTRAGQGVRFVVRGTVTSTDLIQAYSITFSHQATGPAIVIDWPTALLELSPTGTTSGSEFVRVLSHSGLSATPRLTYSLTGPGSAFSSFPLAGAGAVSVFRATLPRSPLCADGLFRIEASGPDAGLVTFPGPSAQDTLQIVAGSIVVPFFDDFETNLGWTYGVPGDTASSGFWTRGDPIGTSGQPELPFSGVTCAFTGQHTPGQGVGFNDVDSGVTTLVSPVFSTAGLKQPRITYRRWFSNSAGSAPFTKALVVEVSSDAGVTWTTLEVVGPTGEGTVGGWVSASVPLPDGVASTASMRVRFRADDSGGGSLIEAAIDNFGAVGIACTPGRVSDINNSGATTTQDIFDFLEAYFMGNVLADVTGDSGLTVQDVFSFLEAYFAGT